MEVNKSLFKNATIKVIDNFESGYYHPNMFKDGRISDNSKNRSIMATSGETMFGLDRHAGHDIYYSSKRKSADVLDNLTYIPTYTFKTPQSKEFWTIIDKANAKDTWKLYYKGGADSEKLKVLASEIMYDEFIHHAEKYLNEDARKLVYTDPKLLFHFIYLTWNGVGFFQKYSQTLNKDIAQTKDKAKLLEYQLIKRGNEGSIVSRSEDKMRNVFSQPTFESDLSADDVGGSKKKVILVGFAILLIGVLVWAVINRKKIS